MSNLKNSYYRIDSIPVSIFKRVFPIVSDLLLYLVNRSFNEGIFPDCLKIAEIVPIHKSGLVTAVDNYRPVSILPMFSKLFEKCMFVRLSDYLEKFSLLSESQFGFRKNRSTVNAVIEYTEYMYECLNEKKQGLGIFVDMRKAFDTISHSTLIRKMFKYGIRGVVSDWFSSYLSGRRQCNRVGNFKSA